MNKDSIMLRCYALNETGVAIKWVASQPATSSNLWTSSLKRHGCKTFAMPMLFSVFTDSLPFSHGQFVEALLSRSVMWLYVCEWLVNEFLFNYNFIESNYLAFLRI